MVHSLSPSVIYEVSAMLVRIVYYLENTLPEERIIVTNDRKKAERIALEDVKKLKAKDYEIEWVA